MPVQLITDKTNAVDLSSGVFTTLIGVSWTKYYKIHCRYTNVVKNWQTNVTKETLNCTATS